MSAVFEVPFQISYFAGEEEPIKTNREYLQYALNPGKVEKIIKNPFIYENIIKHFCFNFSKDAQKELIKDQAKLIQDSSMFLSTITEFPNIIQLIFDLSEFNSDPSLLQIYTKLLFHLMKTQQPNVWNYVKGKPNYQLSLLNNLLEFCINTYVPIDDKTGTQRIMQIIKFVYCSEDLVIKDPNILNSEEFKQVIGRLLLLLNKADLLYISLPTLTLFDERSIITEEREQVMKLHWNNIKDTTAIMREGGILRVLLKLIFFVIKFDDTPSTVSCTFLKYLLLRDKESKNKIKQIVKIGTEKKQKQSHRIKYNAIDIILRKDPEKLKAYNASTEFFLKKVIWNENSILDNLKVNKSIQQYPKEKSLFEQNTLLIMFIISQVFQIAHYELLGISNYKELKKIDITQNLSQYLTGHTKITAKYTNIINLITEILKEEILSLLKNDIDILLNGCKGKYEAHFVNTSELNLETVYTFLDSLNENKQTHEIYWMQKEEGLADVEGKSKQKEGIEKFLSSWKGFIDSIHESLKKADAHLCLLNLLLNQKQIGLILPYLHFITTQNLKTIDNIITNKLILRKQSMAVLRNEQEFIKFFRDFEDRIRDRFCYLSVHLDKMGKLILFIIFRKG